MLPSSAYQIANYTEQGGCIPIRIKKRVVNSSNNGSPTNTSSGNEGGAATESSMTSEKRVVLAVDYQVLMVTTAGGSWVFPKGSVKKSETKKQAAKRETFEEAGIKGKIIKRLEPIQVADHAKGCNITYYPLLVTKKLKKQWDEMDKRQRHWVSIFTDSSFLRDDTFKQHIFYALNALRTSIIAVSSQHVNIYDIEPSHWKSTRDQLEDYLLLKQPVVVVDKKKKKKKSKH
ncbi:hypothetical protein DFA_09528 [Cavenderia fasciculata]|uniref:Nudix hydrolase domain-containing protein n=1 Tax=Cavenderia fasciculata TaxID=261658 RepID=F4Q7V9_CACFS|nr:uncharacterized protein DFA_09528 [Cavenderia fasciculata]EGG15859.1 hypothetical protein DFA_09528 [Cavenderia fasciculata]|eukprot:XP_004352184.1 hypothetical protein DFA_09528 [Cavenderia fasciculata]